MKDFIIHNINRFLEIADTVNTPFKFYEIHEAENAQTEIEAKVWLKTAFLSYHETVTKENLQGLQKILQDHGFAQTTIQETPVTIR
jgi:hypothetical protein